MGVQIEVGVLISRCNQYLEVVITGVKLTSVVLRLKDHNVQIGSKSLFCPVVGNGPRVERRDL